MKKKTRLKNTVNTVKENPFVTVCVILLTVAAVAVTLLLLRTPEEASPSPGQETSADTAAPEATPAAAPPATATPAPIPETPEPTPEPTPTPAITPPAASGSPASGSDIILHLVDPPTNAS